MLARRCAAFAVRRPVWALSLALGLCLLASLGAYGVQLITHIGALLPADHPALARFLAVEKHFGAGDTLGVVVRPHAEDPDGIQQQAAAHHLAELLAERKWINEHENGLSEPLILRISGLPNPNLERVIAEQLLPLTWMLWSPEQSERLIRQLKPQHLEKRLTHIKPTWQQSHPPLDASNDPLGWTRGEFLPWWRDQELGDGSLRRDEGYLRTQDGTLVLLLQGTHPPQNSLFGNELVAAIDEVITATQQQWPHAIKGFGSYYVAQRDFKAAEDSALRTLLGSLGGVLLLFALAYRSIRLPLLIGLTLLPATAAALGLSALALGGTLSMIVSAFAAILIGLGVDFIIHLFNGYSHELNRLQQRLPSWPHRRLRALAALHAQARVGPGIIAAALTTIGTFLLLLASDYRGLGELGAVCGLGLAVALIQVLLVVPAALTLAGPEHEPAPSWWRGIAKWQVARPKQAMILLIASTIGCLGILIHQGPWLLYDSNPRNLRPAEDEIFVSQIELMRELGLIKSGHQVLIRADNPTDALEAAAIVGDRAPQSAAWAGLMAPKRQQDNLAVLQQVDWQGLNAAIDQLPAELSTKHQPFLNQLVALGQQVQNQDIVTPNQFGDIDELKALLGPFFAQVDGETLLRLPLNLSWEDASKPEKVGELVHQLGLPPNGDSGNIAGATVGTAGPPTIGWALADVLANDLNRLAGLAALTTAALLLILLHNVRTAVIAAISLSLGIIGSLALMAIVQQPFNLMNIAVVPLIIGIGIDNGIHLLHALHTAQTREELQEQLTTIGHPILITALTSMVGFGSLGLNAFQGIQSIGLTACLGILACLWMAMLSIPLLRMREIDRKA